MGTVIEALVLLARRRQVLEAPRAALLRLRLRAAGIASVADARAWLRTDGAQLGPGIAQALLDYLAPDDRPLFAAWQPIARLADRADGADWLALAPGGDLVLARSVAGDADASTRFARAVALRAPALVPCLDAGSDGRGVWFLVQEGADLPTLAESLGGRRPLPDADALTLAWQLADGAAALHAHDLAHGALRADAGAVSPSGLVRLRVPATRATDAVADLAAIGATLHWALEGATAGMASALADRCQEPGGFFDAAAVRDAAALALEIRPRAAAPATLTTLRGDEIGTMLVAPRAAAALRPADVPVVDGDIATALHDPWLTLIRPDGHPVLLWAKTSLALGKLCEPPVDVCVRTYPTAANRDACLNISRQHLRVQFHPSTGEVAVCDLGSANGSALDGRPLAPNRAQALTPERSHELLLGQVMRLGIRCWGRTAGGSAVSAAGLEHDHALEAVVLERLANRREMAFAMVLRRLTLGADGAQLVLAGAPGGPSGEVGWLRGSWLWRADGGAWRPLAAGTVLRCGGLALTAEAGSYDRFRD